MTKIKDITNGTAGQAFIKAAGSVSDVSTNSITEKSENVKENGENNSGNVWYSVKKIDRELAAKEGQHRNCNDLESKW